MSAIVVTLLKHRINLLLDFTFNNLCFYSVIKNAVIGCSTAMEDQTG